METVDRYNNSTGLMGCFEEAVGYVSTELFVTVLHEYKLVMFNKTQHFCPQDKQFKEKPLIHTKDYFYRVYCVDIPKQQATSSELSI